MVRHSKGYRNRTRKLLKKHPRERGLPPLSRILREYKKGERVAIKIDPSVHKGQPHRRFHGRTGIIMGKRGRAYIVKVLMGGYEKIIITRPEHLHPLEA